MARPTCSGSSGSGGAARSTVFTAQKRQRRVHSSPSTMIVMVAWSPFQHSPMFGQRASSQTVLSFRSLVRLFSLL